MKNEGYAHWHFFEHRISGIEDCRSLVWGGDFDVTRLDKGRVTGGVVHAVLGNMCLSVGQLDQPAPVRIRGPMARNCVCIATNLRQQGTASYWGIDTRPGDIEIYSAGSEQEAYLRGAIQYVALTMPTETALELANTLAPAVVPLFEAPLIWPPPPTARRFMIASMRLGIAAIRQIRARPHLSFDPRSFAIALLGSLIIPLDNREIEERRRYAVADMHLVRSVEDLLRSSDNLVLSVPELCLDLGVSRRTLERAFQRVLGMSPCHYLMLFRLCRAKEDLAKGEGTVSSIAMKYGFYELGRFSGKYKEFFEELPSETLAAQRGHRDRTSAVSFDARGISILGKRMSHSQ
jgi:AraC family ethanolamine operon transcriptional activator